MLHHIQEEWNSHSFVSQPTKCHLRQVTSTLQCVFLCINVASYFISVVNYLNRVWQKN
jgi:hypothetical protein